MQYSQEAQDDLAALSVKDRAEVEAGKVRLQDAALPHEAEWITLIRLSGEHQDPLIVYSSVTRRFVLYHRVSGLSVTIVRVLAKRRLGRKMR